MQWPDFYRQLARKLQKQPELPKIGPVTEARGETKKPAGGSKQGDTGVGGEEAGIDKSPTSAAADPSTGGSPSTTAKPSPVKPPGASQAVTHGTQSPAAAPVATTPPASGNPPAVLPPAVGPPGTGEHGTVLKPPGKGGEEDCSPDDASAPSRKSGGQTSLLTEHSTLQGMEGVHDLQQPGSSPREQANAMDGITSGLGRSPLPSQKPSLDHVNAPPSKGGPTADPKAHPKGVDTHATGGADSPRAHGSVPHLPVKRNVTGQDSVPRCWKLADARALLEKYRGDIAFTISSNKNGAPCLSIQRSRCVMGISCLWHTCPCSTVCSHGN